MLSRVQGLLVLIKMMILKGGCLRLRGGDDKTRLKCVCGALPVSCDEGWLSALSEV